MDTIVSTVVVSKLTGVSVVVRAMRARRGYSAVRILSDFFGVYLLPRIFGPVTFIQLGRLVRKKVHYNLRLLVPCIL